MEIGDIIVQALRTLLLALSEVIYSLIIVLYNLFEKIAVAEILTDDTIQMIYRKVGLILGLFMLFKLTFSFIQMLINPDTISDKEKGISKIIMKVVIVIVLLGTTPFIFKEAFQLQKLLIAGDNNIIAKVILGTTTSDSANFGTELSTEMFLSFYKDTGDPYIQIDPKLEKFKSELKRTGEFDNAFEYVNLVDENNKYRVEFDGLICVAVGGFLLWTILMYTVSVGIRVVQLAFFQLIAPIPIMSYLSSKKDGMFQKWGKMCITTYIDLFIRLAIMYFIILLSQIVLSAGNNLDGALITSTGADPNSALFVFIKIFIIIGLLSFGLKAPEIIKELFPKSGAGSLGFGFGLKGREGFGKVLSGVLGATTGLISGAVGGGLGGAIAGTTKGAIGGLKGKGDMASIGKNISSTFKDRTTAGKKLRDVKAAGGTTWGYRTSQLQRSLGFRTAGDKDKTTEGNLKDFANYRKNIRDVATNTGTLSVLDREMKSAQASGNATDYQNSYTSWKNARDAMINAALGNGLTEDRDATGKLIGYTYEYTSRQRKLDAAGNFERDTAGNYVYENVTTTGSFEQKDMDKIRAYAEVANRDRVDGTAEITDNSTLSKAHDAAEVELTRLTSSAEYERNQANNSGK